MIKYKGIWSDNIVSMLMISLYKAFRNRYCAYYYTHYYPRERQGCLSYKG